MTLVNLRATPAAKGWVEVWLIGSAGTPSGGLDLAADQVLLERVARVQLDATGLATVELKPTSGITPAGMVYRADFNAGGVKESLVFAGFSGVGPVEAVDFVVDVPGALATPALGAHILAADPHVGYRLESALITAADVAADVATQAELDTAAAAKVDKATLTTDGDLLTRAGGVPARVTRAGLAADAAFSATYERLDNVHRVLRPYSGNPIFTPAAATVYATFADVWYDAGTYYGAVHVDAGIALKTSTDGKTGWVDVGMILTPGTAGAWDDLTVGVPALWKEGATWHLLYRGTKAGVTDRTGHATATNPAGPWTRDPANPVLAPTLATWDASGAEVSAGQPIKVGSTYYLFYEADAGNARGRSLGIATSTDLSTWTKDPRNPIFIGGRFCPCAWKDGDWFYMAVPHYVGTVLTAELELWRCRTVTFYPEDREYLGVIHSVGRTGWDQMNTDTPSVLSDTVNRDTRTVTGGDLWMYYAGQSTVDAKWRTGLLLSEPAPPTVRGVTRGFSNLGPWTIDDLPASRSGYIFLLGSATHRHLPMVRSGSVTAVAILSNAIRTGGTATATVVDGSGFSRGLSAGLDATFTTTKVVAVPEGQIQFNAGEQIGIVLTSDGWAPTTADISVMVEVVYT